MPNLVILTGAGISAESGLATFRAADGLWENHSVEDVATPEGFARDPGLVHRFYNERRAQLNDVRPNAAHEALALLEREWQERGSFLLITQNVDDLHERGGSSELVHMHGELLKVRCMNCGFVAVEFGGIGVETPCPSCSATGGLRPDIVWFGEMPYQMDMIGAALEEADIFVAIGTSGRVHPAASFVSGARNNGRGCTTIEVNPVPSQNENFAIVIAETAVEGVPKLCRGLLSLASV